MQTYEAIYENGKVIFKKKPKTRKARILVTFLDPLDDEDRISFPSKKLGKIKDLNRDKIYNEYLSHRY